MKNHKWKNDKCERCGIERKRKNVKLLMAIVNHPPWEAYKYESFWIYKFDNKWIKIRPSCLGKQ